ncbi:GIN domain-containing protein [Sabulibacter ruber]|uniref:GIN domain-containing protein n=1 Tax=Sabulibacter ruber TaxID=2811901 RepID=UPI001A974BC1|nr:DUF2807 domain-containing protein [Sabulibacter ruber]
MKKSNILVLAGLAFFLCTLTAFNFIMKAEYETGHYKDPYFSFVQKDFAGFTSVEVNGASRMTVYIVQGDYKVMAHERVQEYLQFKQQGNKLIVTVNENDDFMKLYGSHSVLISCPTLTSVTANGSYTFKGNPITDKAFDYLRNKVLVQGFKLDSLQVTQDHATQVDLEGSTVGKLSAVVGLTPGSTSVLSIGGTNKIQAADLQVNSISTLNLHNVRIPAVSYQFSDSARVFLSGTALASLNRK